ncbi:hypothetical protein WSM22_36320 [Cytophagales bacterium WSM2-2]|nr:hypothetical protein WSM22_36320 [Cytophagales bacterium WSM2-2]
MKYPTEWLHVFIPWLGKNILHLSKDITTFTNTSGDTTYDYVLVLTLFSLAVLASIAWSFTDYSRPNYGKLYYWLTVAIRFYVGLTLIDYGIFKVLKVQFPDPGVSMLTNTYGHSTPMGLAWAFFGFSKGYNFFIGVAELASVLLLFRRTMTFGAIITLMTTANVMAVNYFYDVPLKLISTHLFLMTVFLLAKDAEVIWKFFIKGEMVHLAVIPAPKFQKRWIPTLGIGFKILLISFSMIFVTSFIIGLQKQYAARMNKGQFKGYYVVKEFTSKPEQSLNRIWKRMNVTRSNAQIVMMNDSVYNLNISSDSINNLIRFKNESDSAMYYDFKYSYPDSTKFMLKGKNAGDSLFILFDKYTNFRKEFRLTSTGFHWINETPNNR